MPELLHIPFSPWSEKARWALELSGVPYRSRYYLPLLGELELRWLLGRWRGLVTVPILKDGKRVYGESWEIARYADEHATASIQLFPAGQDARVAHYSALSERGLAAGRALALRRTLQSPEALAELVPRPLRKSRRLAAALGYVGTARTLRKYGCHLDDAAVHRRVLCQVLDTLRADLAASQSDGTPRTLLAQLSYADVAMAQVLALIHPPKSGLRIGPASRRAFEDPELTERYQDLVLWRDALYARYRQPASV